MRKNLQCSIYSLALSSVLVLPGLATAQTTTVINYENWNTSQCNAFGNSPVINGVTHRTKNGQPLKVSSGISLQYDAGTNAKGTYFSIERPFLANHTYKVTVDAAMGNSFENGLIQFHLNDGVNQSSNLCSGPENIPTLQHATQINGTSYFPYEFYFTLGNQNKGALDLLMRSYYAGTGVLGTIIDVYVRKITITDITPVFTLVATDSAKHCEEEKTITYTIQNPGNVQGITGYRFELIDGNWLYPDGTPVPSVINTQTNSVTLVSGPCSRSATIKGSVLMGQTSVQTNNKFLNINIPSLIITGPNGLNPNQWGFYQAAPTVGYPIQYNWPCRVGAPQFTWSTNYPNETLLNNTTSTSTDFVAYNSFLASDPFGRTVQLKATTAMCGLNIEAVKDIKITPVFRAMSETIEALGKADQELSVYPNPAANFVTVELEQEGNLELYSIEGKLLQQLPARKGKTTVELSQYPVGVYYLKATFNGETRVKRITKK